MDALSAVLWSERARSCGPPERRAGGGYPKYGDLLSLQELQIARMAAEGLTNREIAQQRYFSHRTVGFHLYRIFPKLGITSLSQL